MKIQDALFIGISSAILLAAALWYFFLSSFSYGILIAASSALIIIIISVFLIYNCAVKSIINMTESINKIQAGDLKAQIVMCRFNEINSLVEAMNRIMVSLKLAVFRSGGGLGLKEIIRAKEEVEKQLKTSENFLEHVIEHSGIPIIAFSKEGALSLVNKEFLTMTGYSEEDINTRDLLFEKAFPSKMVSEKINKALSSFYSGEQIDDFVIPIRCKDGLTRILVSNITSMNDAEGKVIGEAIFMRDLSEIFELEAQIRYWAANGFVQVPIKEFAAEKPKIEISKPERGHKISAKIRKSKHAKSNKPRKK
jgi:PAS domain S-box-containing protein